MQLYSACDLLLARAGATTIAEADEPWNSCNTGSIA